MKNAIQKAIEGGWKLQYYGNKGHLGNFDRSGFEYWGSETLPQCHYLDYRIVFSDPDFWQCLGKALGWKTKIDTSFGSISVSQKHEEWQYQMHRFIDHLIAKKDPDLFFKELLK